MPAPRPRMIDRFELLEPLGEGGMGSVYRARDTVIDRFVALKLIDLSEVYSEAEQDDKRVRVLREARAAAALSHPHIVAVHDAGEEGDFAWIVQELVDGRPFRPGSVPAPQTLELLRQAASALDYAHAHGIVHRDVKPSNLLVDSKGQAKLADFGIAKIVSADQMTRTGSLLGTPQYISPEQLHGRDTGPRSDQFSFAVLAYEAVTGKKPFEADSIPALLAKVLHEDPTKPSAAKPGLAPGLDRVFLKALEKDPGKRFGSCSDFANALAGAMAPDAPPAPAPSARPAWSWIGGAAAIAAISVFFGMRPQSSPVAPTEPSAQVETPAAPNEPEPERPPREAAPAPEPAIAAGPVAAAPRPAPKAARPASPTPAAPSPAATRTTTPALGPPVSVVWSGHLEVDQDLVIENGKPSEGTLSRPWPTAPLQVEVSPSSVEVVEAPSASNNWSRLRLLNRDAARSLVILRYRLHE